MPDLDVVARNLNGPWRGAYRLFKGKQPFQLLRDALVKALAAQIRKEGGIHALAEVFEALAKAARERNGRSLAEVSRSIERRFGFSASARGTAAAALKLLSAIEGGRSLPSTEALAVERCIEILERNFFGRLQPFVGPQRPLADFLSIDQLRNDCLAGLSPFIHEIARRLVKDPRGSGLRAPASRSRRKMTRDLLDEPL
jgi:hypothetical protein